MYILFFVIAGVLAVLNVAGVTSVSWWVVVGFVLAPFAIVLLVFLLGIIGLLGFTAVATRGHLPISRRR